MTDYKPPEIDWEVSPAVMGKAIYARNNPFDLPWLQRLMDTLHRERRDMRVTDRASAEQSTAICKQYSFLEDMRSEMYSLRQMDDAANQAEMLKLQAQERARLMALNEIEHRRAARQEQVTELVARDLEDAIAHRGDASAAEAMASRAAAYSINALVEIEELEARIARLENK